MGYNIEMQISPDRNEKLLKNSVAQFMEKQSLLSLKL